MVLRVDLQNSESARVTDTSVGAARIWIEVDLDALQRNVELLQRQMRRGCRLIAVVKGDAYGHGAVAVARAALLAGASALAVANAAEGAELRAAGIAADILIIGPSLPEDIPVIVAHRLIPALADPDLASALDRAATAEPLAVQLEVDSGLRRHGVDAPRTLELVTHVLGLRNLRLAGIYTHFSAITPADADAALAQSAVFDTVLGHLRARGIATFAHACNTLSSTLVPRAHLDALRIGGGLHGLGATSRELGLTPTMTVKSRVAIVRRAAGGDRVGYGGTHTCAGDTTLAVLPCGYADGLPRATWTGRDVLIRGQRAPIAGLVSMNQTIVDVGGIRGGVAPGEEVVLLGAQGDERVRAEENLRTGSSSYEVTTLLHPAVPRSYRITVTSRDGGDRAAPGPIGPEVRR